MKAMLARLLPRNWNDTLSLMLLLIIPLLWVYSGKGRMDIPDTVQGALIVTWTMVIQYYFRQRPPTDV